MAGISLVILLYIIDTLEYPGGSYYVPQRAGFGFWHNYLCDLLDGKAINVEMNAARFYTRRELGILCVSLLFLLGNIPRLFSKKSTAPI